MPIEEKLVKTKKLIYLHQVAAGAVLDGDMLAGLECCVDVRVHVDCQVLLGHDLVIP
jgi:hypothetical protein